jgi:internalin A
MDPTHVRRHFPTMFYCWSLLPWWLRPRVRLSIRGLMLLVLILGGGFGWVVHRARVQRDAVAAIEAAGGSVRYKFFTLSSRNYKFETPKWLFSLLGPDYLATVNGVHLQPPRRRFRRGKVVLQAEYPGNPDLVMAHVGRLDALEVVQVDGVPITDEGLAYLRGLKRLRTLLISQTKVTGAGLESLAGLHELLLLDLEGLPIVDADLARLRVLLRSRWAVSPARADFLVLDLSRTRITDAGLLQLVGLRRDILLDVKGTAVTDAGAAAFLKVQSGSVDRGL